MKNSLSLIPSLYKPTELTAFLKARGLYLTKALGQNFFVQRPTLRHILDDAEFPTQGPVIEIGPGIGHLTWMLIERGLTVYAVEKDRTFIRILQEIAETEGLTGALHIVHQDALETDFKKLAEESGAQYTIGNLPYNVSVPILFHVAYSGYPFAKIGGMVQKEVGQRILAEPDNKNYGRLSIVLKYLFTVKAVKTVPPTFFFPRPKVESVFLAFTPKKERDIPFCKNYLERVVQIGFQHRRKKLRSQFKGAIVQKRILGNHLPKLEKQFNLDERAEQWPLERWVGFARFIESLPQDT